MAVLPAGGTAICHYGFSPMDEEDSNFYRYEDLYAIKTNGGFEMKLFIGYMRRWRRKGRQPLTASPLTSPSPAGWEAPIIR